MTEACHGFTLFCDDIRQEIGGKSTLVGVYRSEMIFHSELPFTLPKLGLSILIRAPVNRPTKSIKLMVFLPGDQQEIPSIFGNIEPQKSPPVADNLPDDITPTFNFTAELLLSPIEIKKEGYIKVRAEIDGELVRLGVIRVRKSDQAENTV